MQRRLPVILQHNDLMQRKNALRKVNPDVAP